MSYFSLSKFLMRFTAFIICVCFLMLLAYTSMSDEQINTDVAALCVSKDAVISDNYNSIISEFKAISDSVLKGNIINDMEIGKFQPPNDALTYQWSSMLAELDLWAKSDKEKNINDFHYIVKDLNNDGTDELILLLDDTVLAVFTSKDKTPVLLGAYWSRNYCTILNDGSLYIRGSNSASDTVYTVSEIISYDTKLEVTDKFGYHDKGFYHIVNGKSEEISPDEFLRLDNKYMSMAWIPQSEILQSQNTLKQ